MKKFKRFAALALCAVTALSMCACSGTEKDDKKFTVGICQLVEHDALDAATKGFKEKLTEKLEAEGYTVEFKEQSAQGDSATCTTIINGYVSQGVDLILANATAPLQSAAAGTTTIPILGTSVTDYASALDIDGWNGTTGRNISGTSDLAPLTEQAAMIKELFPDAKNVGILYCSAEANSQYQADVIKEELKELGMECEFYTFVDTNDVATVTTKAADQSDVIYVPTDNTVASNTGVIDNICRPAGVPIVAGESGICSGCGVATLSIDYYDLGSTTGEMAYDILVKDADITTMEVKFAPKVTKKYNADICTALKIEIPEGYEAIQ